MPNQTTIENLQKDVTQVAAALDEAKKLEDEALKKSKAEAAELKAETLLSQVTTAKEEANKQLEALKGKTDATSLAEISKLENEIVELEAMLVTLNTSKTELTDLKSGIVDLKQEGLSEEDINKEDDEETVSSDKKKKKNKYDGENTWLEKQIHGLTSKEERKTNTGANIARAVGGIGVIGLTIRGIKKLFGRGKKNDQSTETQNNNQSGNASESTSGKSKRWKKLLIGLGVGTGGYYLVHGIVTGKWEIKDFFDWNKNNADNHDKPEDQIESYEDFVENHPEDAEKYEAVGGNIDELYENIFAKELDAGWQDDGDMATIGENADSKKSLKGLVPFCMDNSFSNVGSMLSEWGIGIDLMEKSSAEMQNKLGSFLEDPAGAALHLFLQALPSRAKFGKGKDTKEQAEAWLSNDTADRVAELRLFFREQMRVTTFLKTKEGSLIKAIADKKYAADPKGFDDVSEAIDDNDRFEKNIENDPDYKAFRAGKLLGAYTILEKYGVMNGDVDEDTQEIVNACDDRRSDILFEDDGGSILERCKTDIQDGSLEAKNKEQLSKTCEKISDDIEDLEGVAEERAMDMYGRLFNTENANRDELLNNSTILPLLREIRTSIPQLQANIQSGKMTAEDMQAFQMFINNYFALKKELEIGVQVYQLIKSDDGSFTLTYGQLFKDSFHNMSKGWDKIFHKGEVLSGLVRGTAGLTGAALAFTPIAIVAGGVITFQKARKAGGLFYACYHTATEPFLKTYQASLWTAKSINGKFTGPAGSLRRRFFAGEDGPEKLINEIREGDMSLKKARAIIKNGEGSMFSKIKNNWKNISAADETALNRKILQEVFSDRKMTTSLDEWDMLAKHFDNRSFNAILTSKTNGAVDEGIRLIKAYDAKLLSLKSNQKQFFDLLTSRKKLSPADMDALIKNIDAFHLDDIKTSKEMKNMAKIIAKDMSVVYNADKFNAKINSVKLGSETEIFDLADPTIAKEKVAFDLSQQRTKNMDQFLREFDEPNGKYKKYAGYKTEYEQAKTANNSKRMQDLDMEFGSKMVDAKDPEVTKILDKIKTDQLKIFNKSIDDNITRLTREQGMLGTTAPDKIAKKTIQKQIDDLAVIKGMATKMNKQELEAFEGLLNVFKSKQHIQSDFIEVRKKSKSDEKLLKALSEGDVDELKRLKGTGISEITDDIIKVFEDIKIKKVVKVLAASNAEDIIKPLLKAFARLT